MPISNEIFGLPRVLEMSTGLDILRFPRSPLGERVGETCAGSGILTILNFDSLPQFHFGGVKGDGCPIFDSWRTDFMLGGVMAEDQRPWLVCGVGIGGWGRGRESSRFVTGIRSGCGG